MLMPKMIVIKRIRVVLKTPPLNLLVTTQEGRQTAQMGLLQQQLVVAAPPPPLELPRQQQKGGAMRPPPLLLLPTTVET